MVVFKWLKIESFQAKSMVVSTNMRLKHLVNMDTFKKQGRNLDFVKQYNHLGVILDNVDYFFSNLSLSGLFILLVSCEKKLYYIR